MTCYLPPSAAAQPLPGAPRVPTREEVEPPAPRPDDRRPPRLSTEGGVEQAPCALADPAYRDISFTLQRASFENLRGLPAEALDPAWRPLVGTLQPLAAVCAIRDAAAAILHDAGYIAAIEIPEQRIADGVVRFDVLIARLVRIQVRGDAGRSERAIARVLGRLTRQEVFNRFAAERYLLLAGDLPGFDVRLALKSAGAARGEVIGEVTVRRIPALIDLNVQDYGSRALGRWGGLVRAQAFGLTGLGDRTHVTVFTTTDFDEQQTVQAGHELRIGGEGLTLAGDFTYSWARPDVRQPGIDLTARTLLATVLARYPLARTQRHNLWGGIGFELIDQEVRFNGLPLSRDKLRIALARFETDATDPASIAREGGYTPAEPRWRLSGTLEARKGIGGLGVSPDCGPAFARCTAPGAVGLSRLEADPTAAVLRAEALGEFRPRPKIALLLGIRGQVTGDPLAAFEEYSAGNYTVGRGYDPGALLGDSGIGLQGEFRFGTIVPRGPGRIAIQPYVFLDAAWISNRDRIFAFTGRERLASVGAGMRAAWGDRARLDVGLAVPLMRAGLQAERGDPRFLVSITTSFQPWSVR